ncbi:MAG: 2-dehydropantoate 2-reductase [Sphingomonas sp.]|nr:2-dehydropantoate 2-reductase [Sphingomonas sp.]
MTQRIVIAGAGSIGCFVGGVLALAGRDVKLLGRGELAQRVSRDGLHVSDNDGLDGQLTPQQVPMRVDPSCLERADVIFVTVKSGASAEMGRIIAEHAPQDSIVVSLQNGVTNADVLRAALPHHDVRAGVVGFNAVQTPDGRFHRATSGPLMAERGDPSISHLFKGAALTLDERADLKPVQYGKLLINLNNALNALSGIPLKTQLEQRDWRRLMADQIDEGIAVLRAEGIDPEAATPIPSKWMPRLLRLPTPLFKLVARQTFKIDPEARSSMAEDFDRGRKTEVEALQGAIIALADKHGIAVPLNRSIREAVHDVEANGPRSFTPEELRA